MWPLLLDMTKEESLHNLRCLEIEAFSGVVSALRAQGALDSDKLKIIKDMGTIFHISQERHKAEIRRVVNDEQLNTIAYYVNGEKHCADEWMEEGRRLIPLVARVAPQTAYSAVADELADQASKINKSLPLPASTERKRLPLASPTHSNASTSDVNSKNLSFRPNEPEAKKRKVSVSLEGTSLSSYLMGPPKTSTKIQQIYRQKTRAQQKEQISKLKPAESTEYAQVPHQKLRQAKVQNAITHAQISPQLNVIQNINVPSTSDLLAGEKTDENEVINHTQACSSSDTPKIINKYSANPSINKINHVTIKPKLAVGDIKKTVKVGAPQKTIPQKTVTTSTGQKLLVVSNTQTLTSSSILQRTLTTIPFKSIRTLDKFKIVPSVNNPHPPQVTSGVQNSKQKVVTVRTTTNKKFSQVQLLNTKGGIKVLPLGGTLFTKSSSNSPSSLYVMNANAQDSTKSISSTPVLMSSKLQEHHTDPADPPIVPLNENIDSNKVSFSKEYRCTGDSPPDVSQDSIVDEKIEDNCDTILKSTDLEEVRVANDDQVKELKVENMLDSTEQLSIAVQEKLVQSDSQVHDVKLSTATNPC